MNTVLVKSQLKKFTKSLDNGDLVVAEVRHDDGCGNGHNTFSITGEVYDRHSRLDMCGCLHDTIAVNFPQLAPFIKWHLCSTDGPMHYIANALYWAGQSGYCNGKADDPPNEKHLKSTIIFGALPDDSVVNPMQLAKEGRLKPWLEARLPKLLEAFEKDVRSLGFNF